MASTTTSTTTTTSSPEVGSKNESSSTTTTTTATTTTTTTTTSPEDPSRVERKTSIKVGRKVRSELDLFGDLWISSNNSIRNILQWQKTIDMWNEDKIYNTPVKTIEIPSEIQNDEKIPNDDDYDDYDDYDEYDEYGELNLESHLDPIHTIDVEADTICKLPSFLQNLHQQYLSIVYVTNKLRDVIQNVNQIEFKFMERQNEIDTTYSKSVKYKCIALSNKTKQQRSKEPETKRTDIESVIIDYNESFVQLELMNEFEIALEAINYFGKDIFQGNITQCGKNILHLPIKTEIKLQILSRFPEIDPFLRDSNGVSAFTEFKMPSLLQITDMSPSNSQDLLKMFKNQSIIQEIEVSKVRIYLNQLKDVLIPPFKEDRQRRDILLRDAIADDAWDIVAHLLMGCTKTYRPTTFLSRRHHKNQVQEKKDDFFRIFNGTALSNDREGDGGRERCIRHTFYSHLRNSLINIHIPLHILNAAIGPLQRSALHYAALYGRVKACCALLEIGADATQKDINGETPADCAATVDLAKGLREIEEVQQIKRSKWENIVLSVLKLPQALVSILLHYARSHETPVDIVPEKVIGSEPNKRRPGWHIWTGFHVRHPHELKLDPYNWRFQCIDTELPIHQISKHILKGVATLNAEMLHSTESLPLYEFVVRNKEKFWNKCVKSYQPRWRRRNSKTFYFRLFEAYGHQKPEWENIGFNDICAGDNLLHLVIKCAFHKDEKDERMQPYDNNMFSQVLQVCRVLKNTYQVKVIRKNKNELTCRGILQSYIGPTESTCIPAARELCTQLHKWESEEKEQLQKWESEEKEKKLLKEIATKTKIQKEREMYLKMENDAINEGFSKDGLAEIEEGNISREYER